MNKPNFYLDNTQIEKITPAGIKTKVRDFLGPSHFIFENNVGKSRIQHKTTLKLNSYIDSKSIEDDVIKIQSRS